MSTTLAAETPPSIPQGLEGQVPIAHLSNGDILWFGVNDALRWNPVSGAITHTPIANTVRFDSATDLGNGLLFAGGIAGVGVPSSMVTWVSATGTSSVSQLHKARSYPMLLNLRDQSVLALAGNAGWKPDGGAYNSQSYTISGAVDLLTLKNGVLQVTPMPDIPGPPKRGLAVVELANGEVMVAGGDSNQYFGCTSCTAETYILNLQQRAWRPGPAMRQARAYASASLLPDGSVLVAGGWTHENTWSSGPTRSVEHLDARQQSFSADAPMLTGMARQRASLLPGAEQKLLLLAGGTTAPIQTYDIASRHWHLAGETCEAYLPGVAAPFVFHGTAYLRLFDAESALGPYCNNNLFPLRLETSTANPHGTVIADQNGHALFRRQMAMVAANDTAPALFIGGIVNGNPTGADSAAVDAIWADGTLRSLAGMPAPPGPSSAFRLADGAIVVMQKGAGAFMWVDEKGLMNNGNWVNAGAVDSEAAGVGQRADGTLLLLSKKGAMTQLAFPHKLDGKTVIAKTSLPNLNRPRNGAVIRGLPDGRIIVAGGEVQSDKIALMTADTNRAEAPDTYVSVGSYLPARRYEIFDPASSTWKNSAPARSAGGAEVILDDGSVVKLGLITVKNPAAATDKSAPAEKQETILERSRPDGSGWSTLGALKPPLAMLDTAKPLVVSGELFLAGTHYTPVGENYGRTSEILQWFNQATRTWETLWESNRDDNDRLHVGRIVTRTLANGKKVVLPVEPQ